MKPAQRRSRHGLNAVKAQVKLRGLQGIDRRTVAARTALAWRRDMLDHMGGGEACTAPQLALIELAVRTRVYIDHCDCFLLEQRSLVNGRRRSLIPLVEQRQRLVDSLARVLTLLGLDRRVAEAPSLASYLASKYGALAATAPPQENPHPAPAVALQETIDDRTDHAHDQ